MFIGVEISRLSGLIQFTAPFSRGGQGAQLGVDILDVPGNGCQLDVIVQHKDASATEWTLLTAFPAILTKGVKPLTISSCKEQMRVGCSISGGLDPKPYDTFLANFLPPSWLP